MFSEKEIYQLALKHAVYNAYKHEGKAELKHVISKIIGENPELRGMIKHVVEIAKRAVEEANKMSIEEQKRFLEENYPEMLEHKHVVEEEKKLPPLPNVEGTKVVKTRFAPNPDFIIHLGNARPAILSYEYAKMYNGMMILRFEDTDPRIKTPLPEAYRLIREDLRWLGISWGEEYIQSLRLEIYYDVAKKLIERGGAYVDKCSKEEFTKLINSGKEPPNRSKTPEHNLELFDKMLEGHYGEGEAVLRVKTTLEAKDKSIIDWVAFRIIDTDKNPHPIVGSKYIVWPTYNFAAAVDDHLLGITHIIRGKEHKQNTIKQQYLYNHMGWKYPTTIHIGRLKLEGFIMSKSEIKRILQEMDTYYRDLGDPRFGTIRGLRRRGITAEAIRKVILEVGAKKSDASISYTNLAAENRKILDPIAPRIMFVKNPVYYKVKLPSDSLEAKIPYHPDRNELGLRKYVVKNGDEIAIDYSDSRILEEKGSVRLMGLANFKVSGRILELHSKSIDEARRLNMQIIQWVLVRESIPAVIVKPEDEEIMYDEGLVENKLPQDKEHAQLIRYGFVKIESTKPLFKAIYTHQ